MECRSVGARTTVKNLRRKLGEDKSSPRYIMAKAESREQLEPPNCEVDPNIRPD